MNPRDENRRGDGPRDENPRDESPRAGDPVGARTYPFPGAGKLLGLDVGLARIGLAVCDPLQLAARPLRTLERASRNEDFAHLAHLVQEEEIVGIVCGLPLNMDGTTGPQAKTTRKWAMRLAHALRALLGRSIPIAMRDERLSSFAAQQLAGRWPPHVGEDAVAAAVILQSLLDARRNSQATAREAAAGPGARTEVDRPRNDRTRDDSAAGDRVAVDRAEKRAAGESQNAIPADAIDGEVIQLPLSPDAGNDKRQQEG